jgi:flagellar basal body rod protein FlgG
VRQGAVEEPNMDPLVSMVDLVAIQRAYAANLDALKAMDSVLATVTSEVGKVT